MKIVPRPITSAARPAPPAQPSSRPRALAGSARVEPPSDRVRVRAYEIYAARIANGAAGDAVSDWLQAERELALHEPSAASEVEIAIEERGERLLASAD